MTASRLAREYNDGLPAAKAAVDLHNEQMTQEMRTVGADRSTILRCLLPQPEPCPSLNGRWCRRFLEMMRWKKAPLNTPGAYLEWDDPRVVSSRKRLRAHIANGVHPYLILNADQVWRQSLRPGKRVFMKKANRSLVIQLADLISYSKKVFMMIFSPICSKHFVPFVAVPSLLMPCHLR